MWTIMKGTATFRTIVYLANLTFPLERLLELSYTLYIEL